MKSYDRIDFHNKLGVMVINDGKFQSLFLFILSLALACSSPDSGSGNKESWMLEGFVKADSLNPILTPSGNLTFTDPVTGRETAWEKRNVLNPAAVVRNDTAFLFYRAQDATGTSRIGLATSLDGLSFEKHPVPVFHPDLDTMKAYEWSFLKETDPDCENCFDGVEDPRIVESPDGTYIMTYTAYDGKTARLALATSKDLYHWQKQGLVLADSLYSDTWSKSGAIVTERQGERMVAVKLNGKFWMYYGDTDLFMATSEDLIHWTPLINQENGQRVRVLHPRPGYFDSRLVEPGPYALLTDDGILLIYNGSNAANARDEELPVYTYAAGQALFDPAAPYKLIERSAEYFLYPDKPYEITGEVNQVCFVEGLVFLDNRWILYYGTADSRIAAAVTPRLP